LVKVVCNDTESQSDESIKEFLEDWNDSSEYFCDDDSKSESDAVFGFDHDLNQLVKVKKSDIQVIAPTNNKVSF
jgi:hypothetical protein